jgi:hypothetical protein
MSARIIEFQSDIEQKLEAEFPKFRDALLGICQTLRRELTSLRVRSPLPSGNISSASVPTFRSTSNRMDIGAFRDSTPDNFSSRHSSPLSICSTDSRTDSVATVLLSSFPHMDSSHVVSDLSLKTI